MYKVFRIIFCVLACMCAAATIFIFAYFSFWGFLPLGCACVFAALMYLFKTLQEKQENKINPPAPTQGDFITGKVSNKEHTDGEK